MRFIVIKAKYILIGLAALIIIPLSFFSSGKSHDVFNVNGREIPIYCVERNDNKIALTFDCAWNDEDIDDILDTLDEYDCKSTFFVVGDWAEKYPESVRKISKRGHEIGNHSYNHADYMKMSSEKIEEDLARCDRVIENIIGKKTELVRAPSGGYNNTVIQTCEKNGYKYIQWSVDAIDYGGAAEEEIYRRACSDLKSGDIILLHNGTENTAKVLPRILKKIKNTYTPVKVSELIYEDDYIIDHTGCQKKK